MSHAQSILTCVLLRVESIFLDMLFCYIPIVEQHNLPFHLSIHCLQLLRLYVCILHNSDVCLINISFEIFHVQIVVNIIRYVIPYSDKGISVTPSAYLYQRQPPSFVDFPSLSSQQFNTIQTQSNSLLYQMQERFIP